MALAFLLAVAARACLSGLAARVGDAHAVSAQQLRCTSVLCGAEMARAAEDAGGGGRGDVWVEWDFCERGERGAGRAEVRGPVEVGTSDGSAGEEMG